MKKQLLLTALMSVTAFSAQASDFGQATADYTREFGQAAELVKSALLEAIGNSLPEVITRPLVSEGYREGLNAGLYQGFYSGYHSGFGAGVKFAGKLALAGIATYYAVKSAKALIQGKKKPTRPELSPQEEEKKNQ